MNRGARGRAFHPGINRGGRPRWAQRLRPAGSSRPRQQKTRRRGRQQQGARPRACIYCRAGGVNVGSRGAASSSPPRASTGFGIQIESGQRIESAGNQGSAEGSVVRRSGWEGEDGTDGVREGETTRGAAGGGGSGTLPSAAPRRERGSTGQGGDGGQLDHHQTGAG